MGLRNVVIGGLLIVVGVFLASGLGTEFGILESPSDFNNLYDTNFSENGVFTNMEENTDTQLVISDPSVNGADIEEVKRFEASSTEDWEDNELIDRFVAKEDGVGDYLTNDGEQQQNAEWVSNSFYLENGDADISYDYREDEAPTSFELTLREVDGNFEETITLVPGTSEDEYVNNETINVNSDTDYEIFLELDDGAEDEQRLYSLDVSQNTSELQDYGSGKYESQILESADSLEVDFVETLGTDFNEQRRGYVEVISYVNDEERETCRVDIEDGSKVFNGANTCVEGDSYSYDVVLETEESTSPRMDSVEIAGFTRSRVLSGDLTTPIQIIMLAVFTTLGLVMIAKNL